ncbi:hypothetical protein N7474_006308 [Penicillium riverlandense]|uniref:uncharacterized protein n=1 Tax=Penicillium riverlandense TaxID=1903569 RepID=UPI0025499358|nr:uncharacterized protein N7474_006308 [Penicillium riverlandense]KAJ5814531.1 hypothetical protein N7474_006308 [Penicillium riverlandense]
MPPRRAHTKSRKGCDQCKRRRVKCDERGPPCSNCTAREIDCTYLRAPPQRAGSHPAHHVGPSPSVQPVTTLQPAVPRPSVSLPATSSVRDLELMHKFSTETYESLCTTDNEDRVWKIDVPRQALQYDFLMNGILALAALHIASTTPPPGSLAYIDTALEYHNLTFAPFRAAVTNITPLNCEAVLAQAVITIVIGIALPQLTADRNESQGMTENIVVVFELLQGVKNIFTIGKPWIKLNLFTRGTGNWNGDPIELESAAQVAFERLASLNDETLENTDPEQHQINKKVIDSLRYSVSMFNDTASPAHVLAWLAAVNKDFLDNVRRRQPLPLLILMHWGVLLGELDGQRWWARNSGRALVSELLKVVSPINSQWQDALTWPQHKMGL